VTGRRCAWCGASLVDGEHLAGRVRCRHCGVATIDPWPSAAELDHAYEDAYRPSSGRFSGPGDALLRWSRSRLAGRLDEIAPPGRILDVGSGDGTLIDALARIGREATGVERESARPDVIDTGMGEIDGEWAGIVFWHSLEHLEEPGTALADAVGLLAPGGILAIALPNADSLQARVFGSRWFALDPPRHLVHVGASALRARLQELGVKIERVNFLRGGQVVFGWADGIVGLLPGHPSLYDAIRRRGARFQPLSAQRRLYALAAGTLALPLALVGAAVEVALRRGGTVYVEARAAR
jgi:SAM-dependent methyltransferase